MQPFSHPTHSDRRVLRYVEGSIVVCSLVTGALTSGAQVLEPQILGFHLVFALLSWIVPLSGPLWQRRGYVALNFSVFVLSALLGFRFDLVMYWSIAKSCFLLRRREVLLAVGLLGLTYVGGVWWTLPMRIGRTLDAIATHGLSSYFAPSRIMLDYISFFLGASTFAVIIGCLAIAERTSRQRAEALTQQVEKLAAALERTRIARDIHDTLGHSLTTLNVQLQLAHRLYPQNAQQAAAALDTARDLASDCLQAVRQTLQEMQTSEFDLAQALEALIHQLKQHSYLNVSLEVNLPFLPAKTSYQLYYIMLEGLTNIQKHAQAQTVTLKGWATSEMIVLTLSDDGCGFDPALPVAGFGLRGMKERTLLIGGNFSLKTAPSQGTLICIMVPR
ncbi:MAG TPA: sensor histidine kinase [Leptolyngbyaceae cyanobacterium]